MAETKTIAFILELDNAKGREREETLSFLRNLMKRVSDFRRVRPRCRLAMTIVFDEDTDQDFLAAIGTICLAEIAKDDFLQLATNGVPYYSKKMVAALNTEADILVYCDSDCRYEDSWLDALVTPLLEEQADLTFGATFAQLSPSLIERACAIAWFFPLGTDDPIYIEKPRFYANNCAITKKTIVSCPIPRHHGSRSHGGTWIRLIKESGRRTLFVEKATSFHKQYESLWALGKRAWLLGKDSNITRQLNWRRSRLERVRLAFSSSSERLSMFQKRLASPAGERVLRGSMDRVSIFLIGLYFQYTALVSQLAYAVFDRRPEVTFCYDDLLARTTTIPNTVPQ